MRLTLRTMLAYLDGILEPDDAQELGRRIEESEQATSVLHRTQDVMRRLRLGAPSLTSNTPGLDPNTVAEYLDNTLQDDRVADFEKVCLESEVHLAEVAACHQVLTLVLGEPAEIDPASRQRMYRLLDLKHAVAVSPPPPPPAKQEAADVAISGNGKNHGGLPDKEPSERGLRQKPVVPDYLRDPPRKKRRLLAPAVALAAVVCVVALGLYGAGQFEPGTPLGDLLGVEATEVAGGMDPAVLPSDQDPPDVGPVADEPDTPIEQNNTVEQGNAVNQLPPPPLGNPTIDPGSEPPDAPLPDALTEPGSELPNAPLPNNTGLPVPEPSAIEPHADVPEIETPDVEVPEVQAPIPEVVAGLATEGQILLRMEPQSAVWQRARFQEGLYSQTRLISLPTFRPKIAMNSGITVQLVDGTEVELLPGDNRISDGMKMAYGRAILTPGQEPLRRFRLQVGDRSGVIVFADAQSAVAVEVATVRAPGTDPEALPAPLVARIYPRTGTLTWTWEDTPRQETGAEESALHQSLQIVAGQCLVVDARSAQPSVSAAALPEWITPDMTAALDARGSKMLEPALQADRSVSLSLIELLDHRMAEVRWVAVRCLGHIGVFEPMVVALNDPTHKAAWPAWPLHIEQLTKALARGPEVAEQVRRAMEKQFGHDEAVAAYRMLWGYTLQGLKEGEGQTLVDYLDHDLLAIRVLSFHNLETETRLRLYYEPEETAAKRRASIRSWNNRLQSKDFWAKLAEREKQ
ncbi:MAG: hypothetical protein V3R99_14405 [Thermoguttaceae bacterium]